MSSRYIIYQGREATDAAIIQLYDQRIKCTIIAQRVGVSLDYIRSVLARCGKLGTIRGTGERLGLLREMVLSGQSFEAIEACTGYSYNTIAKYKGWIVPGRAARLPHRDPDPSLSDAVSGRKSSDYWPCTAAKKSEWRVCYHTRNCQCYLNKQCGVSDGRL